MRRAFLSATIWLLQVIGEIHSQCNSTQFQCNNGQCIDLNAVCDFVDDCGDGSDEQRHLTGFKCPIGRKREICVLPQHHVNDSIPQCANNADLCEVNGVQRCHKCLTTDMIISPFQLCDGVIDCPDLSDECLCERTDARKLCNRLRPGKMIECDNSSIQIPIYQVCNGQIECGAGYIDERFCRHNYGLNLTKCSDEISNDSTQLAIACDGKLECNDFSDECGRQCNEEASICNELSNNTSNSSSYATHEFMLTQVCDGFVSNSSGTFPDEQNCSLRFYCDSISGDQISIDSSLKCNGYIDCQDGDDERNCSKFKPCTGYPDCDRIEYEFGRFYCQTGPPISVPISYVSDGKADCQDKSDECPPFLDESLYTSRESLSKRPEITIWLWLMAIVGTISNILVFMYNLRRLTRRRKLSSIIRANLIMILNLNAADLFTSIYLLIIGLKNAEYSGIYCFKDLEWRTSNGCNALGSFAVFSTEASLLMLTLMTSQRLYTLLDPLNRTSVRLRGVAVGIVLVWCFSALIAILPLFLPQVFVERYWIESKYFNLPLVELLVFKEFYQNLIFITQPSHTSALTPDFDFRGFLDTHYPQFRIRGDFDYYSENTFCVPHFYAPYGDEGWFYPTFTVTINLLAFVYVAIAYFFVYKITTKNNRQSEQDASSLQFMHTLQKRIAKLVLVNFVIWFPICVASYVQLGLVNEFPPLVFVITAVVFFPINSILNPLLYTDAFEKVVKKLKSFFTRKQREFNSVSQNGITQTARVTSC